MGTGRHAAKSPKLQAGEFGKGFVPVVIHNPVLVRVERVIGQQLWAIGQAGDYYFSIRQRARGGEYQLEAFIGIGIGTSNTHGLAATGTISNRCR